MIEVMRSTSESITVPLRVVVVGGGIAGLETVLGLHELAGPRVDVTLVSPEHEIQWRSLVIAKAFSRGHGDYLELERVMADHGGRFVQDSVEGVNVRAHSVSLSMGRDIPYDVLVVALGARPVAAYGNALVHGADADDYGGFLADVEQGYVQSVAFVVPPASGWPLPLYELALLTAEDAWSMNMDHVKLHLVTHENAPLELFGPAASAGVAESLRAAGVHLHLHATARVPHSGHVETDGEPELLVDRVVALPSLEGPRLAGIPSDASGFIAVDDAGIVPGLDGVYAVGDATDRPIKQGGLASQQADVTAAHIAARAGADVRVPPLQQVLRGRLLSGGSDRFMQRDPDDTDHPDGATSIQETLWSPPDKVSGKYLSPYMGSLGVVHLALRGAHEVPSVGAEA